MKEHCPDLFNIVRNKKALVVDVLPEAILNVSFRRPII